MEELILSHKDQLGSSKIQQKIAAMPEYSWSSVRGIARQSLGLFAYKKVNVQSFSESDRGKRLDKGKKLLIYMTKEKLNKTFFTDERLFRVHNPRTTHKKNKFQMIDYW